jgi:S-adenosylmethionine:tRNA ribosyltransferase-isomerase
MSANAPFTFHLPPELSAKEPPERRGIGRDQVRLLVIDRQSKQRNHTRFDRIGDYLQAGDLLVFNSSRTLPAALKGCGARSAPCIEARLAEHLPDDTWLVLLLCEDGDPFNCGLRSGMEIDFGGGLIGAVIERYEPIPRLWRMRFSKSGADFVNAIYRLGQPIRYEYVSAPWDLDYYQTVYAQEPGSAEMPSAGRAFTWKLLFDLKRRGIETAYIVLHTGLSSYMDDDLDALHPAAEEEYFVSEGAAAKINRAHEQGRRIIAVGTTVVRALESAASVQRGGAVKIPSGRAYTKLHITEAYQLKIVDSLLTGMHEPEASHLDLLAAFLPPDQIRQTYEEAVSLGYLWHEFGDLNLII